MKSMLRLLVLLAVLVAALVPSGVALAQGMNEGRVVFGSNFVLKSGEVLYGDLVVVGGTALIETGARVQGNAVLIGGTLDVQGEVTGDVALIGGTLTLGKEALVSGNLSVVGGVVNQDPGARVEGRVTTNAPMPEMPIIPEPSPAPQVRPAFDLLHEMFNALISAVVVSLLAMLAMLFMAPQAGRVAAAISGQPVIAGLLGLLTILLAPVAFVLLCITLILIPVAFLMVLLLGLAWLFGLIALGYEIGERFTALIHQRWAPPLSAGFGTFLLMLVLGGIGLIPCVGWTAHFLAGLLAVGGMVMTTFGTRAAIPPAVPGSTSPASPTPPADPLPPAA